MNNLDVMLASRAYQDGRGLRTALFRHRRLLECPMTVVLWQLGAEPFSAAAVAWGDRPERFDYSVAGEPRNRDLAFAALLPFARWFNARFEAAADDRDVLEHQSFPFNCATTAPQIVVANATTVEMLGRLGRRLAYLDPGGRYPADPQLIRLGRHLRFLWDHWSVPGQQLVVALAELLQSHWRTSQSELERQSLAALDAHIAPPAGLDGFLAASQAELSSVGPVSATEEEDRLGPLVDEFNSRRARRVDSAVVDPLLGPIRAHYRPLIQYTWDLVWRCHNREFAYREASSVERRWTEDRRSYTVHMDWMTSHGGIRRTRQTSRQAATTLAELEEANRILQAEEACDDPVRMIPHILGNKAVQGHVVSLDPNHREVVTKRMGRRPLVTLRLEERCSIPVGKELWWSSRPDGGMFVLHSVVDAADTTLVTLKLTEKFDSTGLPAVGERACFSIHSTASRWAAQLPRNEPWTHQSAGAVAPLGPIESDAQQEGAD